MLRDFFHTPPYTMIAAAPQTVAPVADQEQLIQKIPCPPFLGGALRRGSIAYIMIFMVLEWTPEIHARFSRIGKKFTVILIRRCGHQLRYIFYYQMKWSSEPDWQNWTYAIIRNALHRCLARLYQVSGQVIDQGRSGFGKTFNTLSSNLLPTTVSWSKHHEDESTVFHITRACHFRFNVSDTI